MRRGQKEEQAQLPLKGKTKKSSRVTPSEKLELEACLKRVGEILYNNSETDRLENLEDIETTVREKILEPVSPQITFFFYRKKDGD